MNCVIAKVKGRSRTPIYRKMLSGAELYSLPDNLADSIPYSPSSLLEENCWYKISEFSETQFFPSILSGPLSSADYNMLSKDEFSNIDYIISYQEGVYYYQNIGKSNLQPKSMIHCGDDYKYIKEDKCININKEPDAFYCLSNDTLFFKNLSRITSMFKNIGDLYREATQDETEAFLRRDFITPIDGFDANCVKTANRKRIALALDTLNGFTADSKRKVFGYIKKYCPHLNYANNSFSISNEDELKQLLYGIEQRYYTTLVGNEKRLANSVITLS